MICGRIIGGSVAEWLKAHDSKSCGQQCLGGSNPLASAMNFVHATDRWSVFFLRKASALILLRKRRFRHELRSCNRPLVCFFLAKSVSSNFASQKALPPKLPDGAFFLAKTEALILLRKRRFRQNCPMGHFFLRKWKL